MAEAFPGKDLSIHDQRKCLGGKSLLAQQLEQFPNLPQNPFQMYAKCDGSVCIMIISKISDLHCVNQVGHFIII